MGFRSNTLRICGILLLCLAGSVTAFSMPLMRQTPTKRQQISETQPVQKILEANKGFDTGDIYPPYKRYPSPNCIHFSGDYDIGSARTVDAYDPLLNDVHTAVNHNDKTSKTLKDNAPAKGGADIDMLVRKNGDGFHPADLNEDFRIILSEAITYLSGAATPSVTPYAPRTCGKVGNTTSTMLVKTFRFAGSCRILCPTFVA